MNTSFANVPLNKSPGLPVYMGKAWKVLRSDLNQNEKNKYPSTFVVDGETIKDPATISNEFNNYFVEKGPKLTKKIKYTYQST